VSVAASDAIGTSVVAPSATIAPFAGAAVTGPYTPSQIRHAYGVDQLSQTGAGQTIAIIDAYDDPTVAADLAQFDSTFNLPAANLVKAYPGGSVPAVNSGWDIEIALDVEWAHVIAPSATILLVEAASASSADLLTAVDYGVSHGASTVSMSWGGAEYPGVSSIDGHFNHPGVSFVASAGDSGVGVNFPAVSPYVVGVGGTTVSLDSAGNKISETAWSSSGGGISSYETRPAFQNGFSNSLSTTNRVVPDVAYDADPTSGVYVYENGAWYGVGGTSAGSPQWAGLFALVNQGRAAAGLPALGTGQTYGTNSVLYSLAGGSSYQNAGGDFVDITSGSNGSASSASAGTGYDAVTGLGSPVANKLVPDLIGSSGTSGSPGSSPVVIHAGGSGFTTTGPGWVNWNGYGQGGNLDEEAFAGNGSSTANWSFGNLAAGQYQVAITWPAYSNRASNAPYTVSDGSTKLGGFAINQLVAPSGSVDASGIPWQSLGTFNVSSGSLNVMLSNLANGRVEADAVKVTYVGALPSPTVVVAGGAGFSTTGSGWANWYGYGQGGTLDMEAYAGNGSSTANWAFAGLTPGIYSVQATWPAYSNRASNAPYTVSENGTTLGSYTVNQLVAPSGATDGSGVPWQPLETIVVNPGGTVNVQLSNLANGRVEANEVRLVPMPGSAGTTGTPTVINAGATGFSTTSTGWALWPGDGHNGGLDEEAYPGNGSAQAYWTFANVTPGTYNVSITWPAYTNRASNAPFSVLDGSTVLGTYAINQLAVPSGPTDATGTPWQSLGTFTVSSGTLTVELTNLANGRVEADAAQIQLVTTGSVVTSATTSTPPSSGTGNAQSSPAKVTLIYGAPAPQGPAIQAPLPVFNLSRVATGRNAGANRMVGDDGQSKIQLL
jgi:hypothetical protein